MYSIFLLFISLVLALVISYILGSCIRIGFNPRSESLFTTLFLNMLIGVFVFTAGSALYFTHFKSIFCLLLPLAIIPTISFHKGHPVKFTCFHPLPFKIPLLQVLLPLFLVLIFLFSWFGRLILDSNFLNELPANPETILYSQFSKIISVTGVESIFGIGFLPSNVPEFPEPYHYFDLWFTAGISHLFKISELEAIHFFTLPLFNFLNVLGLCALVEKLTASKIFHPFIALLFLLLNGCYFFPYAELLSKFQFNYLEPSIGLYGEKLSFAFTLILLVFLFLYDKKLCTALQLFMLVPLLFPTLFMPIYIGLPLFYIISYYKKIISFSEIKWLVLFQFIILLCTFFFYTHWGNRHLSLSQISDYKGINSASFKMILAESFYRAWDKPLKTLLLYSPYLLIIFSTKKKEKTKPFFLTLFLLGVCVYISALVSWSLFYKLPEATQIYTNSLALVHVVLILFLFDRVFASTNLPQPVLQKSLLLLLLIASLVFAQQGYSDSKKRNSYAPSFLSQINSIAFPTNEKFVVAYLKNPAEYKAPLELLTGGLTGSYLQLQKQFYGMVNIGLYDFIDDRSSTPDLKSRFQNQNFFTFVEEEKQKNKFVSFPKSQVDFLCLNHINYLAASPKALIPDELLKRTKSMFTDSLTGERFLILDHSTGIK